MIPDLPANPLSIELSLSHRRLWWHIEPQDEDPEPWEISADVWEPNPCPANLRHVADLSLVATDVAHRRSLLDTVPLGEPIRAFLDEAVDADTRRLHPELDNCLSPGPERFLIVRRVEVTEQWQGHGLAAALLAGSLRMMSKVARCGVAGPTTADFADEAIDEVTAALSSARATGLLERIGFWRWRSAHVIDLRSPTLLAPREDILERWWPDDLGTF
ncbi:hypothetical protein BAY60_36080 (plasmid) [Prauserella muralis]|uniref:Uncharacterized protein n=2 Tax=Prauserella muralis TaxID=588067 RepID=A0A2V4APL9_9PSEU|nr:hypothetical protein BAY60_36080 [Prauserella muralis]TWE11140.1 hypothetical protein FHX69_7359 [Prauserella muralis]